MNGKFKFNKIIVYDITALALLCFSIIYCLLNRETVMAVMIPAQTNTFMDFFNHIFYAQDFSETYPMTVDACFPPLMYLFYGLLAKLMPENTVAWNDINATSEIGYVCYAVYLVVVFTLFFNVFKTYFKKDSDFSVSLMLSLIIVSNSFVFGVITRGNSVFFVLILLMLAIRFKDSKNAFLREISLIAIAVAASVKVYPAIFGVIYLYEKRIKEAVRLVIYGVLFFFVPFIFFGGFDAIINFFKNQNAVQSTLGEANLLSIHSVVSAIISNESTSHLIGVICMVVFALVALFLAYITKSSWKRMCLLSSMLVICPFWSGDYTICILVLPFVLFVSESRKLEKGIDIIYTLLFAVIFSLFITENESLGSLYKCIPIYLLLIILMIDIIQEALRRKKQIKSK